MKTLYNPGFTEHCRDKNEPKNRNGLQLFHSIYLQKYMNPRFFFFHRMLRLIAYFKLCSNFNTHFIKININEGTL